MPDRDVMTRTTLKTKPLSKRAAGLAAWRVLHSARDADDAALLLDTLGLDSKQAKYGRDVVRRRGLG